MRAVSLPSRERGLKYIIIALTNGNSMSLPSRERGLKSNDKNIYEKWMIVAPFAGAWIEIAIILYSDNVFLCRSLRGSVD